MQYTHIFIYIHIHNIHTFIRSWAVQSYTYTYIHSSGVGLYSLQICGMFDILPYAIVGSEEKAEFLREKSVFSCFSLYIHHFWVCMDKLVSLDKRPVSEKKSLFSCFSLYIYHFWVCMDKLVPLAWNKRSVSERKISIFIFMSVCALLVCMYGQACAVGLEQKISF